MTTKISLDEEQKNLIHSLKRKMNKVKDAGKKCKQFFSRREQKQPDSIEEQIKLRELFKEHKWITTQCLHVLKMKELKSYISNSEQLIDKMEKYKDKFDEAISIIDNPEQKSGSKKKDNRESINLWSFDLGIEQNEEQELMMQDP